MKKDTTIFVDFWAYVFTLLKTYYEDIICWCGESRWGLASTCVLGSQWDSIESSGLMSLSWVEWWWRECPQQTWICARAFIPCAALCEFFFLLSPSLFLNFGSLPSPASTSIVFLQILDTANLRAISIARSFQFQISPSLPSLSQCLVEFVLDLMSEREHCFVSPRNYILPCRYDC